MGKANPYKPPRSNPSPSRQAILAARMLEIRDRGGFTLGRFIRWHAKRYILRFVYFAFSLGFLAGVGLWGLFYVMLGLLIGSVAQDLGWVLAQRKNWPFQVEIIDWEKVREYADGHSRPPHDLSSG